jgi:hypothetical protein
LKKHRVSQRQAKKQVKSFNPFLARKGNVIDCQ